MSIMWIQEKAKWVIVAIIILVGAGLLLMDQAGSDWSAQGMVPAGEVNGQEISAQLFMQEMENYRRNEAAQSGRAPEGSQLVQMRQSLFDYKVQSLLMDDIFSKYEIHPSGGEMLNHLISNPPQEVQQSPMFQTDSVFDPQKWRSWLASDTVYNDPYMLNMEAQLRSQVIPQMRLQQLLWTQTHRTSLEERYTALKQETKARLKYYYIPADSFEVADTTFSDAALRQYFEAHPDSFHYQQKAARLGYVQLSIEPSASDTALMLTMAQDLIERHRDGEEFAELARSYSDDQGSAEQGGSLGGFQDRSAWVKPFADAAFALDSGKVSQPVLSRFGYHVILNEGRQIVDSVEQVQASHILLRITPSPETVDSLQEIGNKLRAMALETGSLAQAAQAQNLDYDTTKIFTETEWTPLQDVGYMAGVHSFAFSPMESKDQVSEVLQNEDAVAVFQRLDKFEPGRSFERAKASIGQQLAQQRKLEKAEEALQSLYSQLPEPGDSALPETIGMATLDSSYGLVSADSWLAGFGYASPVLAEAFQQDIGQWGPVRTTQISALTALVLEKQSPNPEQLAELTKDAMQRDDGYRAGTLFQAYLKTLKESAEVENNLDRLYRY